MSFLHFDNFRDWNCRYVDTHFIYGKSYMEFGCFVGRFSHTSNSIEEKIYFPWSISTTRDIVVIYVVYPLI
jgi:hypothetical protein